MSSSVELLAQRSGFKPTPSSIPPPNVTPRTHVPISKLPVSFSPLNPIQFLLRAALICPDKLAIAHPNVKHPVYYTYGTWCVFFSEGLVEILHFVPSRLISSALLFCVDVLRVHESLYRTQRIQNLAYALIERGIKPGDRVVVVAPNCPMIAVCHFESTFPRRLRITGV